MDEKRTRRDGIAKQAQRDRIARAVAIALALAFLPLPIQSVLGIALGAIFGASMPIILTLIWINNPITYLPLCALSYYVGASVLGLGTTTLSISSIASIRSMFDFTGGANASQTMEIVTTLIVGSAVLGIVAGGIGYFVTILMHQARDLRGLPFHNVIRPRSRLVRLPQDAIMQP